jgi:ATP-dependent RNA helicase DDX31/DBP7
MDDLQLNFVIEENKPAINVTKVTANLKKGSWKKKRMDAKKIVQRVKKEQKAPAESASIEALKKEKLESSVKEYPRQQEFQRKVTAPPNEKTQNPNFTSSIFTANPELPKIEAKPVEDVEVQPVFDDGTFAGLGLHPILVAHLAKLNVVAPTAIQTQSIPQILQVSDRDIIIQAQTGSGKTYSFLLPILDHLIKASAKYSHEKEFFDRKAGAFAIVLVPTRELAQQISKVLEELLRYTRNSANETESSQHCRHWIVSGILVGGESRKSEKARLRKGVNIVVCTPGRLLDHLKATESFLVGNVRWLILDEADNLLHLGFEESLKEILEILNRKGEQSSTNGNRRRIEFFPSERQTILCSATIEGGVQKLAQETLRDPLFIKAEVKEQSESDQIQIPKQLRQHYVLCPAKLRLVNLIGLLRKITDGGQRKCKVIVFMATGDSVDWHFDALHRVSQSPDREESIELKIDPNEDAKPVLYNDLAKLRSGYETLMLPQAKLFKLHGSLAQQERQSIFSGFSPSVKDTSTILFCTDVAARGLDVPDVTHIVQYDPPADVRDYIHRIGRTARIGKDGFSYVFLLPSEAEYLDLLEDYKCRLQEQPMRELLETLEPLATTKPKVRKHQNYEIAATDVHMKFERFVHSNQTVFEVNLEFNVCPEGILFTCAGVYHTRCVRETHFSHQETPPWSSCKVVLLERSSPAVAIETGFDYQKQQRPNQIWRSLRKCDEKKGESNDQGCNGFRICRW